MRASFLGLEIQKRSVQMAQKALDVTGNNLSNRDTVGYTRQRLDVYSSYMNMNGIYTTKLARLGLSSQGVFASGVSQKEMIISTSVTGITTVSLPNIISRRL